MKTLREFPIGTRVRLVSHPEWTGEVIAHDPDGAMKVTFVVGEQAATGKHSPAALERVGK